MHFLPLLKKLRMALHSLNYHVQVIMYHIVWSNRLLYVNIVEIQMIMIALIIFFFSHLFILTMMSAYEIRECDHN